MYNISKKHGIQLIPNVVWKFVYQDYLKAYPDPQFDEETLEDHLHETFEGIGDGYFQWKAFKTNRIIMWCGFGTTEIH